MGGKLSRGGGDPETMRDNRVPIRILGCRKGACSDRAISGTSFLYIEGIFNVIIMFG